MSGRCPSGKRSYDTYASASEALIELEQRSPRPVPGTIYTCTCETFHISSRTFTLSKVRGRGKKRKRLVLKEGA